MSLRRSKRSRTDNKENNKRVTSNLSITGVTKATAKNGDVPWLGLQRTDGQIVPLRPSFVLGRSNQPPQLPRVDLGLTNANAIHVSKTACIVESVSPHQAVLVIPDTVAKKRVYKPKIQRDGVIIPVQSEKFIIILGDTLIFPTGHNFPNHSFPVVTCSATQEQETTPATVIGEAITTKKRKGIEQKSLPSSTMPAILTNTNRNMANQPSILTTPALVAPSDSAIEQVQPPTHTTTTTTTTMMMTKDVAILQPLSPRSLEQLRRQEEDAWRAPDRNDTQAQDVAMDSDYDDDDEDDDASVIGSHRRPRDMHVTLANTYWKALQSDSPTIGAKLLHLLLDNRRLPTPKLCADLVHLVTFGDDKSKSESHDGTRCNLAYHYIEETLYKYPQIAYDRFGEAAGSDYWKNVFDQLYTLHYTEDEKVITPSLQQQVLSLKLFHRLLNGMIHRSCHTSPIIRDMYQYGGLAACKVAANATAHVWVEFGKQLWDSSSLTPHIFDLTSIMSKILLLLLHEFVPSGKLITKKVEWKECTDILWNAFNGKMQLGNHDLLRDKVWTLKIKVHWIHSFRQKDLEEALAKRLKIGILEY